MPYHVNLHRIPMNAPNDIEGLDAALTSGAINPEEVVAIICKTEGNGRMNDFTRTFATETFKNLLAGKLGIKPQDVDRQVALVMSGGCEGVMTPHAAVFTRRRVAGNEGSGKRLTVGVAFTRDLLPEEIGRMAQVNLVAQATKQAMEEAGIQDPEDVHYVQTKGPLLTAERINEARLIGESTVTGDSYKSMGFSNGSSALGVALGLGEITADQLSDEVICRRGDLYSSAASCSAGVELMNCHIIVIGNAAHSTSELIAGHAVLVDLIDVNGVLRALSSAGLNFNGYPPKEELQKVEAVFVKALTALSGEIRGCRTTLLTDLDVGTRPARAVGNALAASIIGDPMIYVSAGWGYHQGPLGGGVAAVIARA